MLVLNQCMQQKDKSPIEAKIVCKIKRMARKCKTLKVPYGSKNAPFLIKHK